MSNALQEAKDLLAKVEGQYPFKFNQVSPPDEYEEVIGTIRDIDGKPIIRPHEESMSMFVGTADAVDFFVRSAEVLANLVKFVEESNTDALRASETE